jgi:hypothetical protein
MNAATPHCIGSLIVLFLLLLIRAMWLERPRRQPVVRTRQPIWSTPGFYTSPASKTLERMLKRTLAGDNYTLVDVDHDHIFRIDRQALDWETMTVPDSTTLAFDGDMCHRRDDTLAVYVNGIWYEFRIKKGNAYAQDQYHEP